MNLALKVVSTPTPDPVEAEFEKDIWDVRNIPGVHFNKGAASYLLDFTRIPASFRSVVKRYLRFRLSRYSSSDTGRQLRYLGYFLMHYHGAHPEEVGLQNLSRADIETYVMHLRTSPNQRGTIGSSEYVWCGVGCVRYFLEYLERTSSLEASQTAVNRLVWPEDGGRKQQISTKNTIKYIPESVLFQLDQHLDKLRPNKYIPVVLLLRASGWRISDLLNLRWDTCLDKTVWNGRDGWWLCGDIAKTDVLNHKVPISEEIAQVVATVIAQVRSDFTEVQNPEHYLFPAQQARRLGQPIFDGGVRDALDRLARECNITDDMGKGYRFRLHAFRHTKGVELINNGMSLVHVQKWMAHLTPEMTLAYAKILDPTMRQEWEKAFAKGAVRLDTSGSPALVDTARLAEGDNVEWEYIRHNLDAIRLPNGYCFKSKKFDCPTLTIPCHTCPSFCTTPAFLPQFLEERRGMLELIELGEKAGQVQWVERNRQKLDQLEPIIALLETGKLHHDAGKGVREYTPQERERRQQEGK